VVDRGVPTRTGLRFVLAGLFDRLQEAYESSATRRVVSGALLSAFLGALVLIELRRQGLVPETLQPHLPEKHFVAVEWTVDALLVFELFELILGLARSVAGSLAIQLEIFALILLRKSFEELKHFEEPIDLKGMDTIFELTPQGTAILNMGADAMGALIVFAGLVVFRRLQRRRPITRYEEERDRFVAAKKVVALIMLVGAVGLGISELVRWLDGGHDVHVFASVFTGLIFTDIALVLISLRYSRSFPVVFRNFGFTVVTVFLRLAITAPPFTRALLGLFVLLFAVALTWLYNHAHGPLAPDHPDSEPGDGDPDDPTSSIS